VYLLEDFAHTVIVTSRKLPTVYRFLPLNTIFGFALFSRSKGNAHTLRFLHFPVLDGFAYFSVYRVYL